MSRFTLRNLPRINYYEPMKMNFDEYTNLPSSSHKAVKRIGLSDTKPHQGSTSSDITGPTLRKKPRVSYYEPEEPSFDEYIYCDECADFVYEYCAVHGPLLVVPDDKVPLKHNFPSYIPRAALTIPHVFLHLAPSIIPGAGLGVFSTLTLPRGVRFGPYYGDRTPQVDSMYCWQIYDRDNKRSHVVDAANGDRSNWMRYVNCARHWKEQNLLAYQYRGQLYYRTIKIIPRYTELMVFYGSEFANLLGINLSKYNKKQYYAEVTSSSYSIKNKDGSIAYHTFEDNQDKKDILLEECMNTNQFVFIDQENVEYGNHQCDTSLTSQELSRDSASELNASSNKDNEENMTLSMGEDNRLKCEICLKTFAQVKNLRRHQKLHLDGNKSHNCQICEFKTNSKSFFDKHMKYHTECFQYSCNMCFYKTNKQKNLSDHQRGRHKSKEAGIIFKFDNSLRTSDKEDNNFKCEICKKVFGKIAYLERHKKLHLNANNLNECQFCNYQTNSKKIFDKHLEYHTKSYQYSCETCFYKTNHLKDFVRHCQNRHNIKRTTYSCEFCDFKTFSKTNFGNHTEYHTKPFKYSCKQCFYKTNILTYFNQHTRRHEKNNRTIFKCDSCPYKAYSKSYLAKHISKYH